MREFPCKQDENHSTLRELMFYPLTDSSHIGLLVHPERMSSFTPQLPEQLSSAIQPCPATRVNGVQCPLREKNLQESWDKSLGTRVSGQES